MPEPVEPSKLTAREERKWRAEFNRRGREAVREQHRSFRPYIKRDLAVAWLREQEAASESRARWTLGAAIAAAVIGFVTLLVMLIG